MKELTERQKFLLTLVIHEYIRSAAPVGSQYLVEHFKLEMSSATVRNELAALTDLGYLRQPHTSAGRVPSEEGYRYFVGRLMQETELPDTTRRTISHQFYQMRSDIEQWMRLTGSVLSNQSHGASLVTAPHPETARLKHLELISTRGRQLLMVLVMMGGEVHQRLLTLAEPATQEQLSRSANYLTDIFQGMDIHAVRARQSQMEGVEAEIIGWIVAAMQDASSAIAGEIYLDGLTNVLSDPEFSGSEDARRAMQMLEERSLVQDLVARTALNTVGGVQVLIGGEGAWAEMRPFSMVLARYGTPGLITGMLGVIGPMRMPYGRTISTVRFLSNLLSELVNETLIDQD